MQYSVLIPMYNSEKSISILAEQIDVFFKMRGVSYEMILVNDASTDSTKTTVEALMTKYESITLVDQTANIGQQRSLFNGLGYCSGEYVITIDDDLQHNVQDMAKLMDLASEGNDLVFGIYEQYGTSGYRHLGSKWVGRFFKWRFKNLKGCRVSSFRLMAQHVYKPLTKLSFRPFIYLSAELIPHAGTIANCKVQRHERRFGKSGYPFKKLLSVTFKLMYYYGLAYRLTDGVITWQERLNRRLHRVKG